MKAQIHPKWYPDALVTCSCGNTFTVGSTMPEVHVELCSNCHPFYTGQMKFLDVAGRVDAFRAKQTAAKANKSVSKTEKRKAKRIARVREEESRPESLSELRKTVSKK